MKNSHVSLQYAKALFDSAGESQHEAFEAELKEISLLVSQNQELAEFLFSPVFPFETKDKVLLPILKKGGFSELVVIFLRLLLKRKRLEFLDEIYQAYRKLVMQKFNRESCLVETAYELDAPSLDRLRIKFEKVTGKKMDMEVKINPYLIGGIIARVGEKVYDFSLRSRINAMSEMLLNH